MFNEYQVISRFALARLHSWAPLDRFRPNKNANQVHANEIFALGEKNRFACLVLLSALLQLPQIARYVVDDMLLQTLHLFDLVDFRLVEQLEVLVKKRADHLV